MDSRHAGGHQEDDLPDDLKFDEIMKTVPDILKNQLSYCGYNSVISIYNSSDKWISNIEEYIRKKAKNKSTELVQKITGDPYCTNSEEFEIPPGHVDILRHIKSEIVKKKRKLSNRNSPGNTNENLHSGKKVKPPQKIPEEDFIKQTKNLEKLILNFLKSKNFSDKPQLSVKNAINKKGESTYSGTADCIICQKIITIHFDIYNRLNKRWVISNYIRHINEHIEGPPTREKTNKELKNSRQKLMDQFLLPLSDGSGNQDNIETEIVTNDLHYVEDHDYAATEENLEESMVSIEVPIDSDLIKIMSPTPKTNKGFTSDDPSQRRITEFFKNLNDVVCENDTIKDCFNSFVQNMFESNCTTSTPTSKLLDLILQSSTKAKGSHGDRYDETIKKVCVYLFIIGGRRTYEILQSNLPLPSISTVSRYMSLSKCRINEGEIRISQLEEYLEQRDLSKVIWLSEDATRIVDRVEYDPITNTLVGLVAPLENNGLPTNNYFKATNAKSIEQHILHNNTSKFAYTIMAQPLDIKTPPFCLGIFGTDNQFHSTDVIKRWKYIRAACAEKGIIVLGVSGDGDSRILRSMEVLSGIGKENLDIGKFFCMPSNNETGLIYTQDTIHIGNKLRNRLFKKQKPLKFGTCEISLEHLVELTKMVNRGEHCIRDKDLDGSDRMNFEGVVRICNEKVQALLEAYVPESKGTRMYLQCIRYITEAFLTKELQPLIRLKKLWFVVFMFRIWRYWIVNTPGYSLMSNFITRNSYMGVELNAHALTLALLKDEDDTKDAKFLPDLFSSQACEQFFRTLRSMTSTLSTVVNFSTLEILYRIGRVDLQEKLNIELSQEGISLPRFDKQRFIGVETKWPRVTKDQIQDSIRDAEHEALFIAFEFGLGVDGHFETLFNNCKITPLNEDNESDEEISIIIVENEDPEEDSEAVADLESIQSINLTTFKNCNETEAEDGPYVTVKVEGKPPVVVKKTSLVWLLRKQSRRVSTDRLHRFKKN